MELEEELKVVGNSLKSLEVSEEKVGPKVSVIAVLTKSLHSIERVYTNFCLDRVSEFEKRV